MEAIETGPDIRPGDTLRDTSRPELGELKFVKWSGGFRAESFAKCKTIRGDNVIVRSKYLQPIISRCCVPPIAALPPRELLAARLDLTDEELDDALKD